MRHRTPCLEGDVLSVETGILDTKIFGILQEDLFLRGLDGTPVNPLLVSSFLVEEVPGIIVQGQTWCYFLPNHSFVSFFHTFAKEVGEISFHQNYWRMTILLQKLYFNPN